MRTKRRKQGKEADVQRLLGDLLIVNLAVAGVPQQAIRKIVGCDIGRVNAIAKHIRQKLSRRNEN